MKYIRTKDGRIFDTERYDIKYDKNSSFPYLAFYDKKKEKDFLVHNQDIEKEADTIEDLFDGILFKDTKANKLHLLDKDDGISLLGAMLFEETLRGFIETDKGLIYVAKLNDKGEWELV